MSPLDSDEPITAAEALEAALTEARTNETLREKVVQSVLAVLFDGESPDNIFTVAEKIGNAAADILVQVLAVISDVADTISVTAEAINDAVRAQILAIVEECLYPATDGSLIRPNGYAPSQILQS